MYQTHETQPSSDDGPRASTRSLHPREAPHRPVRRALLNPHERWEGGRVARGADLRGKRERRRQQSRTSQQLRRTLPASVPWHSSLRSSDRYFTEPVSARFSQPTICAAGGGERAAHGIAAHTASKSRASYVVREAAGAVSHGAAAGEVGARGGQALGVVQRLHGSAISAAPANQAQAARGAHLVRGAARQQVLRQRSLSLGRGEEDGGQRGQTQRLRSGGESAQCAVLRQAAGARGMAGQRRLSCAACGQPSWRAARALGRQHGAYAEPVIQPVPAGQSTGRAASRAQLEATNPGRAARDDGSVRLAVIRRAADRPRPPITNSV